MKNAKYFKVAMILSGILGVVLFISNSTQFINTRFGKFWKTTTGTILSCKVEDDDLAKLGSLCRVHYEVQFNANKQTIKFTDKDPLSGSLSYKEAMERSKLYPPGTEVLVYYDPKFAGGDSSNSAFFDRPHGPTIAKLSNIWRTILGLVLMGLAFVFGLFTEARRMLLILGVQFMRLLTATAVIFCFSVIESNNPSTITIGFLIASIPISVVLVIFLFSPCVKAIDRVQTK